jgi:hypothetical protein
MEMLKIVLSRKSLLKGSGIALERFTDKLISQGKIVIKDLKPTYSANMFLKW